VRHWLAVIAVGVLSTTAIGISAPSRAEDVASLSKATTICQTIDAEAAEYGLPIDFFTRLIWKESRFRSNAVSPVGAQGIAQFMPQTAALRGLADPFDAAQAIPASAHYLSDLADSFGNLGLAAAAYNAGEARVSDWLAGGGGLPAETQDYVAFITGRSVGDWKNGRPEKSAAVVPTAPPDKPSACADIAAALSRAGAGSAALQASEPHASAAWAPWGVQLAGNFSEAKARASFAAVQKQYVTILGQSDPLVVRTVMRSRGTAPFFNIRIPAATRAEADALCAKLHAAGGACTVMKNSA
jgi:transglycosylase-like protein with SLT domain/sporulation related protein